jgi:hypothetical protein
MTAPLPVVVVRHTAARGAELTLIRLLDTSGGRPRRHCKNALMSESTAVECWLTDMDTALVSELAPSVPVA